MGRHAADRPDQRGPPRAHRVLGRLRAGRHPRRRMPGQARRAHHLRTPRGELMTTLAIHTDCPILPLTRMVGDTANIEVGQAVGGAGPDCFYGWPEPVSTRACRPHHIVWGCYPEETLWMAKTLARLDHQVVV